MRLEYSLDQKVPFLKSLLLGFQWAALLVSTIILLGKVVGGIHFPEGAGIINYLQKLLFVSAITLFSQVFWGHRLPLIPGPAAVLLIGVIASKDFNMSTIYTSIMIGGLMVTILALSGLFGYIKRYFTSNVVSVVLLLIAFTIAPTILDLIVARKSGTDPLYNMGFAFSLLFLMFVFYRLLKGIWESTLIIWAIIAGSIVYSFLFPAGPDADVFPETSWISGFIEQMTCHLSINPGVLISFMFCYLALVINDLGSIQAVNELIETSGKDRRIKMGISLTGLANILSGFFGVIGPVNYSISPGVIVSTKCASRFTLLPAAAIMFVLALSPAATGFIGSVPSVVIGSVLAYVMASQISAGLMVAFKDTGGEGAQFENGLVIGLSVLLGNIVAFMPGPVINGLPQFLKPVLGNGFVVGVMSAIIMEQGIFRKRGRDGSSLQNGK